MAYNLILLFLITFKISVVYSERKQWCPNTDFVDVNNNIVNKDNCKSRPCIISTCRYGEFNHGYACKSMKESSLDFSEFLKLYKVVSGKPVESDKILDNTSFQVVTLKDRAAHVHSKCLTHFYIVGKEVNGHFLQNGSFLLIDEGGFKIIPAGEYVVRFTESRVNGVLEPELRLKYAKKYKKVGDSLSDSKTSKLIDQIFAYVMLVSCLFMILVIIVYVVCKELRTTAGLVLLTYVTNLAITFFLTAVRTLGIVHYILNDRACYALSVLQHFFMFSSFTWMDIMGFDIWWTLRKLVVNRPITQAADYGKFALYCCIAWIPWLVYVIIEVYLQEFNKTYGPKFDECTARANLWYWVTPILALQLLNLIPFVQTIVNLWHLKKSLQQLNSADSISTRPTQNAFLSVKISIAIGTNWFLDILVLLFDHDLPIWFKYTAKILNGLNGVILFFVFVFKTNVLLKFFRRLSINNGISRYLERRLLRKTNSYKSQNWIRYNSSNATITKTVYSEPDVDTGLSESE